MRRAAVVAWVVLSACPTTPEADRAAVWPVKSFIGQYKDGGAKDFGGWTAQDLVTGAGHPIPYRSGIFAEPGVADELMMDAGWGLTVFPGYSGGRPVAYTITDIWYHTPQPWVQPVYLGAYPTREADQPQSIFPVGVDGTFYSSFWRGEQVSAPDGSKPAPRVNATSATALLNALSDRVTLSDIGIILCPLVPANTTLARSAAHAFPVHPFTLEQLVYRYNPDGTPNTSLAPVPASVDGAPVTYLGFGTGRAPTKGDAVIASKAYFFGLPAGADFAPLPLPAVLPDDAIHHSLVQRVEVSLPDGVYAYLPPARAGLAAGLRAQGVPLWVQPLEAGAVSDDAGVVYSPSGAPVGLLAGDAGYLPLDLTVPDPVQRATMLKLATNPECFGPDAGFPNGCQWLDSAAAVEQLLNQASLNVENVTLSVGVLVTKP